jgi:predicted nucleic acid-binding protein
MQDNIFLDTAFAIALISPRDFFHEKALELASQIEAAGAQIVTTRAVVIEIGNALSKESMRTSAVELINSLDADETVTIVVNY